MGGKENDGPSSGRPSIRYTTRLQQGTGLHQTRTTPHGRKGQDQIYALRPRNPSLEGVKLRTHYPSSKLAPKIYGPFPIKKVLSDVSYELELPAQWKIHPVIHANLLTPYKETALHGPNFI